MSRSVTPSSSIGGTPHSHRSHSRSYQETETGEGQGEIQSLARKILEFVEGEPIYAGSQSQSHIQPGSSIGRDSLASHRDHDELRKSVREAFSGGTHGY